MCPVSIELTLLLFLLISNFHDLNNRGKLEYFSKYETNDNKPFSVSCKPYFINKHSKSDTDIVLSENGELILKNQGNCE